MSLYADFFYGSGALYGSDADGNPGGGPVNLTAYQNTLGTVVLYWSLDPCSPFFSDFTWFVDTDLVDTFDSSDLRSYVANESVIIDEDITTSLLTFSKNLITGNSFSVDIDGSTVGPIAFAVDSDTTMAAIASAIAAEANVDSASVVIPGPGVDDDRNIVIIPTAAAGSVTIASAAVTGGTTQATVAVSEVVNTIAGCVHKGVFVPAYKRLQNEDEVLHWRVRGVRGDAMTAFISSTFTQAEAIDESVQQAMLDLLARQIYQKDGETNIKRLYDAFAQTSDDLNLQSILVERDLFTRLVRDQSLAKNFGALIGLSQPATMKTIDFREIVRVFLREVGGSPSVGTLKKVTASIFCEEPDLTLIRDTLDMHVDDPTSTPVVEAFHVDDPTSSPTVDPPTAWDDINLAFGTIVDINNPLACPVSLDFTESVIRKVIPVHSPVYIIGL